MKPPVVPIQNLRNNPNNPLAPMKMYRQKVKKSKWNYMTNHQKCHSIMVKKASLYWRSVARKGFVEEQKEIREYMAKKWAKMKAAHSLTSQSSSNSSTGSNSQSGG